MISQYFIDGMMPESASPVQPPQTIIAICAYRNGWQCFEAPGVQPYWTGKETISYATTRGGNAVIRMRQIISSFCLVLLIIDGLVAYGIGKQKGVALDSGSIHTSFGAFGAAIRAGETPTASPTDTPEPTGTPEETPTPKVTPTPTPTPSAAAAIAVT